MSESRRDFLRHSASCAAHLALAGLALPPALRTLAATPRGAVVAREPFGTLEKIADGVWALVSTPFGGDRTTLCNGGLVAGRNGVLAIEGFFQPAGAAWLATKAKELTGRWPTHVVLTHYHADHANGIAGYLAPSAHPLLRATAVTRDTAVARNVTPPDPSRVAALADVVPLPADAPSTLDLGGRVVRLVPRDGHTASDVSLELDDPGVVFAGDLLWNGIFPNYVDAVPSRLAASVRALRRARETVYVPGHGPIATAADYDRYEAMLAEVEQGARAARAKGLSAAEGGKAFTLSPALGTWTMFNPVFFERAFGAWYRELERT